MKIKFFEPFTPEIEAQVILIDNNGVVMRPTPNIKELVQTKLIDPPKNYINGKKLPKKKKHR